ncbi:MAG: hypothetical protein CML99_11875 [Rhodobiaceae bacterium]|nr:hypothetical protein [Rhodobiaceae bacterium]
MSDFRIFPIRRNQVVSFVLLLGLSGGLAACATGPTSDQLAHADYGPPPPENHQEVIKEWFEERLIDPTSPLYSFRNPVQGYTNDSPLYGTQLQFGWIVCGAVNAKNRLGAYVGREPFLRFLRMEVWFSSMMAQLLAKPASGLEDNDMSKIENLLAPGEQIVYRGRFGGTRLLVEVFAASITLMISAAMGPLGLFVGTLVLVAWIYGERTLQKVVVTSRRLIHKKPRFGMQVDEINLTQIESIKDNGQRLIVHGTGGTRVKLPYFLKDRSILRNAMQNPGTVASDVAENTQSVTEGDIEPFWKRHKIITGLGIYLAVSALAVPFIDDNEGSDQAVETATLRPAPQVVRSDRAVSSTLATPARHDKIIGITEEISFGSSKRSLVVRLAEPIDEATLASIARGLQSEKPNFAQTYIVYLLPGMVDGAGAWATTHFNPDLKVQILGLSVDALEQINNAPVDPDLIGRWVAHAGGYTITIRREGNRLVFIRTVGEASTREPLRERTTSRGTRYDFVESNDDGAHFILLANGMLEARDDLGLVSIAPPI